MPWPSRRSPAGGSARGRAACALMRSSWWRRCRCLRKQLLVLRLRNSRAVEVQRNSLFTPALGDSAPGEHGERAQTTKYPPHSSSPQSVIPVQTRRDPYQTSEKTSSGRQVTMGSMNLGHPTGRKPPFKYSSFTRVGFSDTDAQGSSTTAAICPISTTPGSNTTRIWACSGSQGCDFVMRACNVVYEAPARFDDLLEVFVRTKRSDVQHDHRVRALRIEDDVLMCTAEQTLVLIDPERRPAPIPDDYREASRGSKARTSTWPSPDEPTTPPRSRRWTGSSTGNGGRRRAAAHRRAARRPVRPLLLDRDLPRRGGRPRTRPLEGARGDRARPHPDRAGHLRRRGSDRRDRDRGRRPLRRPLPQLLSVHAQRDRRADRLRGQGRRRDRHRLRHAGRFRPTATALLERVAVLISQHCLVAWDTGGVPWQA